jgi:predicted HTH domain antitoxin
MTIHDDYSCSLTTDCVTTVGELRRRTPLPRLAELSGKKSDINMEAKLVDDMFEALTEAGGIDPREMRTEALRLYLNTHPGLKLDGAVALWRNCRVSLAKAAEIAGLTVPEFKEVLATQGITRETEGKPIAEIDAKLHEFLP